MKKYFYILVMALISAVTFTSCDKEDSVIPEEPIEGIVDEEVGEYTAFYVTLGSDGVAVHTRDSKLPIVKKDGKFAYALYTTKNGVKVSAEYFYLEPNNVDLSKDNDDELLAKVSTFPWVIKLSAKAYYFVDVPVGAIYGDISGPFYSTNDTNSDSESKSPAYKDWEGEIAVECGSSSIFSRKTTFTLYYSNNRYFTLTTIISDIGDGNPITVIEDHYFTPSKDLEVSSPQMEDLKAKYGFVTKTLCGYLFTNLPDNDGWNPGWWT